MTGNAGYANLLPNPNVKKGVHNMCDVAERLENKGRAEGREEGREEVILCQEKVQIKNDFFPSCQHT